MGIGRDAGRTGTRQRRVGRRRRARRADQCRPGFRPVWSDSTDPPARRYAVWPSEGTVPQPRKLDAACYPIRRWTRATHVSERLHPVARMRCGGRTEGQPDSRTDRRNLCVCVLARPQSPRLGAGTCLAESAPGGPWSWSCFARVGRCCPWSVCCSTRSWCAPPPSPKAGPRRPSCATSQVRSSSKLTGEDAGGWRVWKSDGTPERTTILKDGLGLDVELAAARSLLVFSTRGALWKSDGTPAGTVVVKALPFYPNGIKAVGDVVYFSDGRGQLWEERSDRGRNRARPRHRSRLSVPRPHPCGDHQRKRPGVFRRC